MVEKVYPMTLEGKEKLEQELEELKTIKRKEIVERIKIARSFGDLSENSEYESAKDEQAFVEGRITTLENMIRFAEIIDTMAWTKTKFPSVKQLLSKNCLMEKKRNTQS